MEAARAGQTAIAHILNLSLLPASLNVRVPQLRRHDQVVFTRLHLLGRILTLQKAFQAHFTAISLPYLVLNYRIRACTCPFSILNLLAIRQYNATNINIIIRPLK